jgi:hypothetical protein
VPRRKSTAGNITPYTTSEPSIARQVWENIVLFTAARPGIRAALIRALNRFPHIKRRLKIVISQASLRAWVDANRRREAAGVDDLSAYAARVFKDLERERIRLARQADRLR